MADVGMMFRLLGRDESASRALRKLADQADHSNRRVGALNKVGSGLGRTFSAAGKVAAVGVGAIAAGLGAVIVKGAGEIRDFEKNVAQTNAAIKSTGGAAGVSAKEIETLASKVQGYSGQTDDAVHAGANLLLTFTNIQNKAGKGNDIFDQSVKTMADLSQTLGQDTTSSAMMLGKALNDPVKGMTALGRAGIQFTAGQKSQIKALVASGKTLEAQKLILKELNTQVGGSAEAFGKSLPGQIERAKRAFEDFAQQGLTAVMPILLPMMRGLANLATRVAPHVQRAIGGIATALKFVVAGFKSGDAATSGWRGGMEKVGAVIKAVAGWVSGTLWPALQKLGSFLGGVLMDAWNRIREAIERNRESFRKIAEFIGTKVVPVLTLALGGAIIVVSTALAKVMDVVGLVQRAFETGFGAIQTVVEKVWGVIGPIVRFIVDAIQEIIDKAQAAIDLLNKLNPFGEDSPGSGWRKNKGGWFANGGSPPVGVPSVVGERGPEFFVPKTAGTIIPNHQLGGSTVVYNVTLNGSLYDDQGLLRAVQTAALRNARRNGGNNGLSAA